MLSCLLILFINHVKGNGGICGCCNKPHQKDLPPIPPILPIPVYLVKAHSPSNTVIPYMSWIVVIPYMTWIVVIA